MNAMKLDLLPGEVVDITVRAVVGGVSTEPDDPCPELGFSYAAPGYGVDDQILAELTLTEAVTVKRVTPAEGTPVAGDVWSDRREDLWFAWTDRDRAIKLRNAEGRDYHWSSINDTHGPLKLVYRKPRLDAGETVDDGVHRETGGWVGPPGQCGASCACGVTFDGFDTLAEASVHLSRHIENPEAPQ